MASVCSGGLCSGPKKFLTASAFGYQHPAHQTTKAVSLFSLRPSWCKHQASNAVFRCIRCLKPSERSVGWACRSHKQAIVPFDRLRVRAGSLRQGSCKGCQSGRAWMGGSAYTLLPHCGSYALANSRVGSKRPSFAYNITIQPLAAVRERGPGGEGS